MRHAALVVTVSMCLVVIVADSAGCGRRRRGFAAKGNREHQSNQAGRTENNDMNDAAAAGQSAEGEHFSAELAEVYAWCDHMPGFGANAERRQFLTMRLELTNKTDKVIEVSLDECRVSFDAGEAGDEVNGVRFQPVEGQAGGDSVTVQPGQTLSAQLRGDGAFEEDRHGQTLHATVSLSAGGETLSVRNSAEVEATS